jgi:hypothetical protein
MEYTKKYNELKSVFNPDINENIIPGSGIRIVNPQFSSDPMPDGFSSPDDRSISENITFSYPVFVPENRESRKVILLLHGLNERSWVKYLVWAYWLCSSTGSYIVLFPISFHINRSPSSWKDPRAMIPFLKERKLTCGEIEMSSFANIALSNRLTEDPTRFFKSGYQTACDIVKLMSLIRNGKHAFIPAGCKVNIFAYSIGAFLAEIILMGNQENLFSESKLFMFCGGSIFSNMHGTSKLIMDSLAYEKVFGYYMKDFEKEIKGKSPLVAVLRESQIGMAFRSMIDLGRFRSFREKILKRLREQTYSVALSRDMVIPADGIVKTLNINTGPDCRNIEVWDFPYSYSHENPFPVFDTPLSKSVDQCFERLFTAASFFLA